MARKLSPTMKRRLRRSLFPSLPTRRKFMRSSSSSSSSSSGFDKSLCFWASNAAGETEWYAFNLSTSDFSYKQERIRRRLEENKRKRLEGRYGFELVPARPIEHHHCRDRKIGMGNLRPFLVMKSICHGCCIAFESILFFLGGSFGGKRIREVRCLDITCPENGWTIGPPMLAERVMPHAVVLGGKIYVMGGTSHRTSQPSNDPGPWAEVFDPCLKEWKPIAPPPSGEFISAVATLDFSMKILLSFHKLGGVSFIYDVRNESWEKSDHELMIPHARFGRPPVVVGDTVYWFMSNGASLYAYDFELNQGFFGSIKGLEGLSEPGIDPSLLHLGGDVFCLFWTQVDCGDNEKSDLMRCHCFKFRVSKGSESSGRQGFLILNVSPKSCQSYCVDHCICFMNSKLLSRQLDEDFVGIGM